MHQVIDLRWTILLTFVKFAIQTFVLGGWFAMIPSLQIASRVSSQFGPRRVCYSLLPFHGAAACLPFFAKGQSTEYCLMSMRVICGFLIGPPVIGILGDTFSLKVGLAALITGLELSLVLAKQLQTK